MDNYVIGGDFLQNPTKDHDSQTLFEEESNIWGGMGDDILASKVFLQIKINDKIEICSPDEYNKPDQNNRSALGYALFPVIQNEHTLINPEQLTFKLKIKAGKNDLNDTQWQAIQDSMPIRLAQVDTLGYDGGHVRLPSDSVGISTHLP